MDKLLDKRADCYSVMLHMKVCDYLKIINQAYENSGGLEGQRDPLKTSTAIRIRKRMAEDLRKGAILPPIVLGAVVPDDLFRNIKTTNETAFIKSIHSQPENISIIDGMQRTTAMLELSDEIDQRTIRVEYWIAKNTNSLIYRMLVLNTGQVPWDLRRQIEVIFRSMIQEIDKKVTSVEILGIQDQKRRSRGGQFQASHIIELFLVFGARKEKIDTKERLADEFTRLDFIEATSDEEFNNIFYEAIDYLGKFDKIFDRYNPQEQPVIRFKAGKDLFASQPARVGFIAAIALEVLGRPGIHYERSKQQNRWNAIKSDADSLLSMLGSMDDDQVGIFLDLETLSEVIGQKSAGKVGDFEREFFLKAFKVLIEEKFSLETMTPCWRAY